MLIMRSKHVRTPYAVRRTYSMNMHWLFHVKVLEEFSRVHWFKQSLHDSAIVHNYVLAILVWVNICVVVRSLVRQSMYYIYNDIMCRCSDRENWEGKKRSAFI